MNFTGDALVCSVLAHSEHGAVVRILSAEQGLLAGYVRGGRSSKLRPVLVPGNTVKAQWRARVEDQLGSLTVELARARSHVMLASATRAAALAWVSAFTAVALPVRAPYPRVHAALEGLLDTLDYAEDDLVWAPALVRFELTVLAELGFGLDLSECAATGTRTDLTYVSPRSARAVSRTAGLPYAPRLLALPAFLLPGSNAPPRWADVRDGLALSGHFLGQHLLTGHAGRVRDARDQLLSALPG
jgi:DNA repair protein RecO (recombination protein O)